MVSSHLNKFGPKFVKFAAAGGETSTNVLTEHNIGCKIAKSAACNIGDCLT